MDETNLLHENSSIAEAISQDEQILTVRNDNGSRLYIVNVDPKRRLFVMLDIHAHSFATCENLRIAFELLSEVVK